MSFDRFLKLDSKFLNLRIIDRERLALRGIEKISTEKSFFRVERIITSRINLM